MENLWEEFGREVCRLGVRVGREEIWKFQTYLRELQEWNEKVRLVSRSDDKTVVWMHFYDSVTVAPLVAGAGSMLDVGSGAGFPGVPVKIVLPWLRLCVAEVRRKRVSFLRHILRVLRLEGVEVWEGRIEEMDPSLGPFDVVVARAVAEGGQWLRWLDDLVRPGTKGVVMIGGDRSGFGDGEFEVEGWIFRERVEVMVPVFRRKRSLLVLEKV